MTKEEKLRKIAHKKEALWAEIVLGMNFLASYVTNRDDVKKVLLLVNRYNKLLLEEKALKKS